MTSERGFDFRKRNKKNDFIQNEPIPSARYYQYDLHISLAVPKHDLFYKTLEGMLSIQGIFFLT